MSMGRALAKILLDHGGGDQLVQCSAKYPCPECRSSAGPRPRRPVAIPRTRQFNDTLLGDVHFWEHRRATVLVYSLIDEATRFHLAHLVPNNTRGSWQHR